MARSLWGAQRTQRPLKLVVRLAIHAVPGGCAGTTSKSPPSSWGFLLISRSTGWVSCKSHPSSAGGPQKGRGPFQSVLVPDADLLPNALGSGLKAWGSQEPGFLTVMLTAAAFSPDAQSEAAGSVDADENSSFPRVISAPKSLLRSLLHPTLCQRWSSFHLPRAFRRGDTLAADSPALAHLGPPSSLAPPRPASPPSPSWAPSPSSCFPRLLGALRFRLKRPLLGQPAGALQAAVRADFTGRGRARRWAQRFEASTGKGSFLLWSSQDKAN